MTTEREIKLDVPEDFEMPDVTKAAKGLAIADGGTATYDTAWFDTPDFRLARWGASLRYRDGQGWTLKLDPVAENGMLFRGELTFEGDAGSVPEAVTDLVRAYARGAALAPRVRATTTRRRLMIGQTDRPVVELVDDAVEVTEAPSGASRFRQIEIEVLGDDGARVARDLAKELRAAGAPKAPGDPKVDRALGGHPEPEFEVPPVGKGSTIGVLVRAAIAEPVRALISHAPGVRLGRDPEDVHKARVATRRLRSNLRTFGDWLEADWAADLRTELGWLADDLGAVRDADVMFDRLRDAVEALDDEDRAAGAALLDGLATVRAEAGERLLASTATDRYDLLLDRLVAAARAPSLRGATDAPARAAAPVVEAAWRKLRRAVRRAKGASDPTALHRVRIRAKRARYAAEAVQPAFGGRADAFARLAAELQDVLGEHHDAIVLEAWLREAAAKSRARQAFVAGELAAQQRRTAGVQAAAWRDVWRSLARKRNRFWT
ncbi:MAG TPA: CHAD domain-containing protein [Actinomycetota bacterium]